MGLFDFLKTSDLNQGAEEQASVAGSILLDVRTPEEYRGGHLPESRNLPLQNIEEIAGLAADRNTPIYTYCLSGARSSQATALLKRMGYQKVKNIGGINQWYGRMEK